MKLECLHADTCLPDYWGGHHLAHIQIPVYRGMTLTAIKESIRDELRMGAVCGSDEIARLLSDDFVTDEKRADQVTRAAYAAVNRIKPARKGQRRFFTDLEEQDEDCCDCRDLVFAFFVFEEQ